MEGQKELRVGSLVDIPQQEREEPLLEPRLFQALHYPEQQPVVLTQCRGCRSNPVSASETPLLGAVLETGLSPFLKAVGKSHVCFHLVGKYILLPTLRPVATELCLFDSSRTNTRL